MVMKYFNEQCPNYLNEVFEIAPENNIQSRKNFQKFLCYFSYFLWQIQKSLLIEASFGKMCINFPVTFAYCTIKNNFNQSSFVNKIKIIQSEL